MLITGLACGVINAVVVHFLSLSAERGVGHATATAALSAFSLVAPVGPLVAGALADRVRGPRPLAFFYSLPLIALVLLVTLGAPAVLPVMILLGVGFSAATGMLPYLLTRYFGIRHASQLFGVGLGIVTLSMGLGPVLLGFAHDRCQSFTPSLPALLVLSAGALAASLALRDYSY